MSWLLAYTNGCSKEHSLQSLSSSLRSALHLSPNTPVWLHWLTSTHTVHGSSVTQRLCEHGSKGYIPVCAFQCSAHRTSHSTERKRNEKHSGFFYSIRGTSNIFTSHQRVEKRKSDSSETWGKKRRTGFCWLRTSKSCPITASHFCRLFFSKL